MTYLIDGHNLIPKIPGLSLQDFDDEEQLVGRLQQFSRLRRKQVEVYFDRAPVGFHGQRAFGQVKAHFVRQGITADQAIQARLKQLGKAAKNYIVVSSDHQVQAFARSVHAQVVPSEVFARELISLAGENRGSNPPPDQPLSEQEVAEWEEFFRQRPAKAPRSPGKKSSFT